MVPRDLIAAVPPRALQVWCCLAQWCDAGDQRARPSIARIAGELDVSRDVVERSLRELEASGRLIRQSGKAGGKRNEYTLILTRLGTAKTGHPYRENAVPTIKVVNQDSLTNTPIGPRKRGRERIAPAANQPPDGWPEFWSTYPVKTGAERARRAWEQMSKPEREAAQRAAQVLASVFAAASAERRRYTPAAARWLREKRWTDHAESIETRYNAPGAATAAAREASRRAANEAKLQAMRQETVSFRSLPKKLKGTA